MADHGVAAGEVAFDTYAERVRSGMAAIGGVGGPERHCYGKPDMLYFRCEYRERNMKTSSIAFAAISAVLIAVPAWAHHSHANYDQSQMVEMDGTVTQVMWMNPHVWLYIEVEKEDGSSSVWALEGGSVGALMRGGWQPDSIAVGDNIRVRCYHLKDGSDGCLLGYVTTDEFSDKEFD
jgi:hypothetical protein